jgi:hypothetical protein
LSQLCKTNPISEKPKMNLNFYSTKDYENDNTFRLPENKPKQTQYDWNPAPRPGTNARFDTGLIPPLKESEAGQLQIGTERGKM